MDAGLATMLFVLVVSLTAVESQITKGPANALKIVGDSVTLECVTNNKNCANVEWSKMEGAQSARKMYTNGIILSGFPRERYSINSTGGCSLTIIQLNISDSGRFTCSQLIRNKEELRSCVLVVIGVRESCLSNVTNGALNQNDRYSFRTAINVPSKTVASSNVILSFHNMAVGEIETMDDNQSQTVNTTLTGIARKANITQRVCRASLPPNTAASFDRSTATLDVCTTQQLIVSYPVENIAVSPSTGPYYKGATVRCTADGHPYPTFKWTYLMRGANVADGDTLVIMGEAGDKYKCTAMNTINGKVEYQSRTIEVSPESSCKPGCIAGFTIIIMFIIIIVVVIWVVRWRRELWGLKFRLPDLTKKDDDESANGKVDESEKATNADKFNENESSLTEYESLQQRELSPSDAYESIKPKKI